MTLNSLSFLLLFLPIVVIGVHVLRKRRGVGASQAIVALASLVFYASNGLESLGLLVTSITFNWAVAQAIEKAGSQRRRRFLLVTGLAANVALLCVFKYGNASVDLFSELSGHALELPKLGFPLGVSFFTLTQVMYLVDCYERLVPPARWLDHFTFISFFPNITAGPLLRAKLFFSELRGNLGKAEDRNGTVTRSATLIALGLVKKAVIGNSFRIIAVAGFGHATQLSTLEAWITSLAGTFELYFDFSGYSDMALGCAGLMGMTLVQNFNTPFRSAHISEFWTRWHISLSRFITTYLYTPILRSMGRATLRKSAVATVIAMVIVGAWHGPTWAFVLFGVLHGFALAGYQYWKRRKSPLPRLLSIVLTFLFVNLTFTLVMAPNLATALQVIYRQWPATNLLQVSVLSGSILSSEVRLLALPILFGSISAFIGPDAERLSKHAKPSVWSDAVIISLVVIAYVFMRASGPVEFIYRQF